MPLTQRLPFTDPPVFLIDGTSFFYRAFYAYPDLKRSDGFPTNAIFIVLRLLLRLIREERPDYVGFFMDGPGPTFRHERFPAYKAQRLKAPEDLIKQISPLVQAIDLLGLTAVTSQGVEADDLIASACARFKKKMPVVIVGSDKDLMQCLDHNVVIWDPGQKNEKLVTLDSFTRTFAMRPDQWPDYQALIGDSSDNIPGIPGVGPKTAQALMQRFPTLEDLRGNTARLSPRELKKIGSNLDNVFLYRELTRLRTDLHAQADLDDFRRRPMQDNDLRRFLDEYEFRSLAREIASFPAAAAMTAAETDRPNQQAVHNPSDLPDAPVATPKILTTLPDLTGKQVAVWPETAGWLLAFDQTQWLWPRADDHVEAFQALLRALLAAERVLVHSWKDLLNTDAAWAALDMTACFDVSLAGYLLHPEERDYGLKSLARVFSGELSPTARFEQGVPALLLLNLGAILAQKVAQGGFKDLLTNLEMPLIQVLVAMEKAGVLLDRQALGAFLDEVQADLERLSEAVFAKAGGQFNLRSSQQLAAVLFERLELKTGRKTPGGSRSTSSDVLEKLAAAHPIVPDILEYRKLEKLRSTYLEPLPRLVDDTGRLHTTFNQLATATGRLSSSNPNLQNIPIRGPQGRRMRACFTAPRGRFLVSADYSQIELRILAHLSEDPHLLTLFAQGTDIHAGTAAILFAKEPGQVSTDERRKAKTINFGLLYGMGPQKLSRELGISLAEAKDFMQLYFSRLSKVREFYDRIVDGAKEQGAVFTLAGRRRLLPDIHSRNEHLVQTARRMAINTVVQGSAADVIKMAMIQVHRDEQLHRLQARMILQVHDELLLESPQESAHEVGARVEELMSLVTKLRVPLVVDWGVGPNWAKAHA